MLRSYNYLVLHLCLWTCALCLCYTFNVGWILEQHGRHDWTVSLWYIRVDPCPKSPYIYTFNNSYLYIYYNYNYIYIENPIYLLCCLDSPLQSSGSPAWCRTYGLKEYLLLPFETPSYIFIYIFLLLYNNILLSMCNLNPTLRLYSIVCYNPRLLVVY